MVCLPHICTQPMPHFQMTGLRLPLIFSSFDRRIGYSPEMFYNCFCSLLKQSAGGNMRYPSVTVAVVGPRMANAHCGEVDQHPCSLHLHMQEKWLTAPKWNPSMSSR